MNFSARGFRCPEQPVLAANVVDANGTRFAAAVVQRDYRNTSLCITNDDCSYETAAASIQCDSISIAQVASVPLDTVSLSLGYNNLARLNLSSLPDSGNLQEVDLNTNQISSLDDILLPASVQTLVVDHNNITTLHFSRAFSNLVTLKISYNPILRVLVEASGVATLEMTDSNLTRLSDLFLPSTISSLSIGWNPQMKFENFTAPKSLRTFSAQQAGITKLRTIDFSTAQDLSVINLQTNAIREVTGVMFPPQLENLDMTGSNISCFILRESDVAVFQAMKQFNISSLNQKNCSKSDAQDTSQRQVKVTGSTYTFSVLPDISFEARYFAARVTIAPSPVPSPTDEQLTPDASQGAISTSGKSSNTAIYTIIIGVVVVLFPAIGFFLFSRRRRRLTDHYMAIDTETDPSTLGDGHAFDDIRSETMFAQTRIPQVHIVRSKLLGKGAYGIVHLATLKSSMQVVVKQILPDKAKQPAVIQQFMDEIRLCAQLNHPNIVRYIGVSWSTLADLSVIMEFVPNGDLASLLEIERTQPRTRETFTWTTAAYEATATRTKLQLAIDIAVALVYLHSLSPPVIHRDLKASNVLLSEDWAAKLSDFGISRTVGNQMTAEVGTTAWTAPEILTGAAYDEAADVYSFGIVLSELDTCEKPFASRIKLRDNDRASHTNNSTREVIDDPSNARIALAVTEKGARPDFHVDCPPPIFALALRCLARNPTDRPTAVELLLELKSIAQVERKSLRVATLATQSSLDGIVSLE